MNIVKTRLDGVLIIEPQVHRDNRGFFLEVYRRDAYRRSGITDDFVQDNHSRSARGVLRGIHFQDLTAPVAKLVRCSAGRLFDVAVDLRVGSPQFGEWIGTELSADNMHELYIPIGFGHAVLTVSERADLEYKCSGYYAPVAERVIAWNDPDIGIDWPILEPLLSGRDKRGESLRDYLSHPAFRYRESAS